MCQNVLRYLSPSAAYRWVNCPGSAYIIEKLPRLPSSSAAEEGTLAHTFAAHAVATALLDATGKMPCGEFPSEPEYALGTPDITDGAQVYADAICAKCGEMFGSREFSWAVEKNVSYEDPAGLHLQGRLDFAAWNDDAVIIADYKFGGEFVQAAQNPQLISYALCMIGRDRFEKPKSVSMGIIQPRTDIADFSYGAVWSDCDYAAFEERALKVQEAGVVASGADESTYRNPGEHCRWCPARSVCRASIGEKLLLADIAAGEVQMASDATDEQIGVWLDALRIVEQAKDDLVRIAKVRMHAGAVIPGWRLQARRGKQWAKDIRDEPDVDAQAEKIALAVGCEPANLISRSLKTPASMSKTLPKEALEAVTEETATVALVQDGKR